MKKHHILFVCAFYVVTVGLLHRDLLLHLSTRVIAGQLIGGANVWLFWLWHHLLVHRLPLFHTNLLMFPDGLDIFF